MIMQSSIIKFHIQCFYMIISYEISCEISTVRTLALTSEVISQRCLLVAMINTLTNVWPHWNAMPKNHKDFSVGSDPRH